MPDFYAMRLKRHFNKIVIKDATSFEQYFSAYKRAISSTLPVNNLAFLTNLQHLLTLTQKIESNGGKVVFIRFPTGKLVWEVDQKKYPKHIFWNNIQKMHSASVNFSNYYSLSQYDLPDGSHLDFRDKKKFTVSLMNILNNKNFIK